MRPLRRNAPCLLLAGLAAGACTEQTPPTGIPDGVTAAVASAGANNQKVKVKTMQLGSNTLRIDGPSVSGQVSIGNSGLAIQSNVVVRAEITRGASSRQAVNTPTQCSPAPADAGMDFGAGGTDVTCAGAGQAELPPGVCTVSFTLNTRNTAGAPAWQPGEATFRLELGQGSTVLDAKSLTVFLNIIQ